MASVLDIRDALILDIVKRQTIATRTSVTAVTGLSGQLVYLSFRRLEAKGEIYRDGNQWQPVDPTV